MCFDILSDSALVAFVLDCVSAGDVTEWFDTACREVERRGLLVA